MNLHRSLSKGILTDMKETVHNSIAKMRKAKNVTQEEMAQAVGVTRQTIIAIEKGNYTPSVLLALKLAVYFKVSVDDLFSIHTS